MGCGGSGGSGGDVVQLLCVSTVLMSAASHKVHFRLALVLRFFMQALRDRGAQSELIQAVRTNYIKHNKSVDSDEDEEGGMKRSC